MDQDRLDVFLSYNEKDRDAITYLAVQLRSHNIRSWLACWNLVPGKPWQKEVVSVLEQTKSCVVLVGPNGIGEWQEKEVSLAVDRQVTTKNEFRVIPVLLPGTRESAETGNGRSFRERLKFIHENTWVEFQSNLDESEPLRRLVAGIKGMEPGAQPTISIAYPLDAPKLCPYRGLEAFGTDHAPFFFGRHQLVQTILQHIEADLTSDYQHRFLAIIGPSGSGKSSFVRAGVVHELKQGLIATSDNWPMLIFDPSSNPLKSFAISLEGCRDEGVSTERFKEIEQRFLDSNDALEFELRSGLDLREPGAPGLLIVDQFEQIFTLCKDEKKRRAFISNLLEATRPGTSRIYVIIAMRADFYSKCFRYANFANVLASHQIPMPDMGREDLTLTIVEPAKKVACRFESGLVARLLQDLEGSSVGLPLLEHTLLELWRNRENDLMTHKTYDAIGGISGALEKHAEKTFLKFNQFERNQCKLIFMRLTQPGDGGEYTKRQTLITEIVPPHKGSEMARESAIRVLQTLTSAGVRLITTNGSMIAEGRGYAEVSHEALIRNWSRLRRWIEEDREGFRILHRLNAGTREWLEQDENKSFLYRGALLMDTLEWAQDNKERLSEPEKRFLSKSLSLRRAIIARALAVAFIIILIAIVAVIEAIRERDLKIEIQRKTDAARLQQIVQDLRKVWLKDEKGMQQWLEEANVFANPLNRYQTQLNELQDGGAVKPQDQERYANIAELDQQIRRFALAENGAIALTRQAMDRLRSMRRETIEIEDVRKKWAEVIEQIADKNQSKLYEGLLIKPQEGLIPLGKNQSGLFEFAHYMTGSKPERDGNGLVRINGESAVILVLLPGDHFFRMGAKKPDPTIGIEKTGEPNIDEKAEEDEESPVNTINLEPFFISKYEMTQGQWERATFDNRSLFPLDSEPQEDKLLYPVESVSWHRAREGLVRVGLDLPTEAQWEYAARAGQGAIWSSTNDASMVNRYGHISTKGEVIYAPCRIGTLLPNAFGLFDTIGNVWEWCIDQHCHYTEKPASGSGQRSCQNPERIFRGGSFYSPPPNARVSLRRAYVPEFYNPNVGIRPARTLDK